MDEALTEEQWMKHGEVLAAEIQRIYGGAPMGKFALLPFHNFEDTAAFLRLVPDNSGEDGIRAAIDRHTNNLRQE